MEFIVFLIAHYQEKYANKNYSLIEYYNTWWFLYGAWWSTDLLDEQQFQAISEPDLAESVRFDKWRNKTEPARWLWNGSNIGTKSGGGIGIGDSH